MFVILTDKKIFPIKPQSIIFSLPLLRLISRKIPSLLLLRFSRVRWFHSASHTRRQCRTRGFPSDTYKHLNNFRLLHELSLFRTFGYSAQSLPSAIELKMASLCTFRSGRVTTYSVAAHVWLKKNMLIVCIRLHFTAANVTFEIYWSYVTLLVLSFHCVRNENKSNLT